VYCGGRIQTFRRYISTIFKVEKYAEETGHFDVLFSHFGYTLTLKMKDKVSSKRRQIFTRLAQYHIVEGGFLHIYRRENLRSHM
jgi:hypothetical protein